jgi:hypothetical protein
MFIFLTFEFLLFSSFSLLFVYAYDLYFLAIGVEEKYDISKFTDIIEPDDRFKSVGDTYVFISLFVLFSLLLLLLLPLFFSFKFS